MYTSLNPALMKVFLSRFSSAKPKGPGVPGAGAGARVSCLTILIGSARKGTLSGVLHIKEYGR